VGLRPTAVVRLERALAHEVLPLHDIDGAHPSVDGCTRVPVRRPLAAPRRSRKLVPRTVPFRHRPQTPTSITEEPLRPAAGRIRPLMVPPDSRTGTTARRGPSFPACGRRAVMRLPSVARLWTGLLASPSPHVGRQGHGARADPGGHPIAVSPGSPAEQGPDLQRCRSRSASVRSPGRPLADRAQPVDTGVEPVRPRIHSG
jgi:hypothetical protein